MYLVLMNSNRTRTRSFSKMEIIKKKKKQAQNYDMNQNRLLSIEIVIYSENWILAKQSMIFRRKKLARFRFVTSYFNLVYFLCFILFCHFIIFSLQINYRKSRKKKIINLILIKMIRAPIPINPTLLRSIRDYSENEFYLVDNLINRTFFDFLKNA